MTETERNRLDIIEGKVDLVLVKLNYLEAAGRDHETRVRSLEKWKYGIPAAAVSGVLAVLFGILVK